jgi:hypothetical protein
MLSPASGSFEMVYDITLICQQALRFFTAVFGSGFHLKLQSVIMMASSRQCLLENDIEQSLSEELTASDKSNCSDDISSGTDILTIVEVTGSECSNSENEDVQCATASSAPTASSATFTWEDMTNTPTERKARPTKGFVVCYKSNRRKETVLVPRM